MAAAESNRSEQIISNFHLKALHLVLQSRIPHFSHRTPRPIDSSRPSKRDRWFNLAIGDHPAVLEALNFWNRGSASSDPMVVDVLLSGGPLDSDSVVERWVVEYKRSGLGGGGGSGGGGSGDVYVTYKKTIVLFRSMYSMLRLLPAYKAFRMLNSPNQNYMFSLTYKVSTFAVPIPRVEEDEMEQHFFMPVETKFGQMEVSVLYKRSLTEFDFEGSPLMLPRIITDYVGSPAADPLRTFPASLRATSFPSRNNQFGSRPLARPHSWTSPPMTHHPLSQGLEQIQQNASPPGFSGRQSLAAHHLHRTMSYGGKNRSVDMYMEHKFSPPFSPSPTPSPPTYPNSPLKTRTQSETAPVTIPLQSRSSLPPPSPRRDYPSSVESPSCRKIEGFKIGDLPSSIGSYTSPKGIRDNKDEQGHFSGIFSSSGSPRVGFSRSSSRLSSQDLVDDPALFCPFALDDLDSSESQNRSADGKEGLGSSQPFISSQDAAVGLLVQTLRSAPPLRRDPSYSSDSTKSGLGEEASSSSFFLSRKKSDALEELRSYREMKDVLLSRSGLLPLDSSSQT